METVWNLAININLVFCFLPRKKTPKKRLKSSLASRCALIYTPDSPPLYIWITTHQTHPGTQVNFHKTSWAPDQGNPTTCTLYTHIDHANTQFSTVDEPLIRDSIGIFNTVKEILYTLIKLSNISTPRRGGRGRDWILLHDDFLYDWRASFPSVRTLRVLCHE